MEERYEFKGKIGQGGLGTVYRAFDARMSREVAIKRILENPDDNTVTEEATRQLIKEAGSLASLQHPNIVTIYDVGTDSDGPFVVMELLSGESLEQLICKGTFTWPDFRQLARQSMEALIAAQELHIVHRDLKPANIMLTWLPSGKFQVKIVDFGLAKLSAKPSLQTIDQSNGVFGSIYFMAPEQFERVPIDLKTDLYAMGCVYYYALTGTYPYDGDTAPEVMVSHLQHYVTPLQEVREGIPLWACEWVMWLINRQPSDRPESAREALKYFVENDQHPSPPLSTGIPAEAVEKTKRPRLVIPGSAPVPEVANDPSPTQTVKTAAKPIALLPPQGSKPSVHTTAHVTEFSSPATAQPLIEESPSPSGETPSPSEETPPASEDAAPPSEDTPAEPEEAPASPDETPTAAVGKAPVPSLAKPKPASGNAPPLLRKAGSATAPALKPKGAAAPVPATAPVLKAKGPSTKPAPALKGPNVAKPPKTSLQPAVTSTQPAAAAVQMSPTQPEKARQKLSPVVKVVIAVVLGLFVVGLGVFALNRSRDNAEAEEYNAMIKIVENEDATELPVNERKLEILLRSASSVASSTDRYAIYKALFLAKSTDGTDVDARIAEFATTQEIIPDVRVVLIRDVLRKRKDPAVIGTLLDFARSTDEIPAAVAAIEATRFMATDKHFSRFLDIIRSTDADMVRKAAEENAAEIIKKSDSKQTLGQEVEDAQKSSSDDAVKHSLLRLLGRVGGDSALALAGEYLKSGDVKDKIAAIVALGNWSDDSGLNALIDYLGTGPDLQLRARAYESAYQYIISSPGMHSEKLWTLLSSEAKTQDEQMKLIRGLANIEPSPWAFTMLGKYAEDSEYGKVIDLAERAIVRLKDVQKTQAPKPKEE